MVGIPVPIDASALNRRISALENTINAMAGARSLTAATISEGGLTIRDGGDLTIRDGGELHVDGLSIFGGDMRVTGTLSLPAGIIDNAALASPAAFDRTGAGESNFDISLAGNLVAKQTIAVPAGYSRAIVLGVGAAAARNSTAAPSFLYVGVQIGTTLPNQIYALAPAGGYVNASGNATRLLTGLSGGVIDIAVRVSASVSAWTATTSVANLDAIAIFLR